MDPGDEAAIRAQLAKIIQSKQFARSKKKIEFLGFIVEETLAGRGDRLKAFLIGQEIFGKDNDFDPAHDKTVNMAASELREKLAEYYQQDGRNDTCIIDVPKGGFVPTFTSNAVPTTSATGSTPAAARLDGNDDPPKKSEGKYRAAFAVLAVLAIAGGLWAFFLLNGNAGFRIKIEGNGAVVGQFASVTVDGWSPGLNHYLIVEPLDNTGQRWVQFKVEGSRWSRVARFGQTDTPSGTRFRVYVLSTKSELANDELKVQPEAPIESPAITVTLQK